jgi:hypothetical protein
VREPLQPLGHTSLPSQTQQAAKPFDQGTRPPFESLLTFKSLRRRSKSYLSGLHGYLLVLRAYLLATR